MPRKVNNILFVVSECVPFAKAGGIADVAGALPAVLKKRGYDIRIFMPMYGLINWDDFELEKVAEGIVDKVGRKEYKFDVYRTVSYEGVEVYFLHNHKLYGSRKDVYGYDDDNLRFYMLDRGALQFLNHIDWRPEVIHCNDWHSGLIPYFLNYDDEYSAIDDIATLYTIHNLSYQKAIVPEYDQRYGQDDGEEYVEPNLAGVRKANFAKRGIINADMINAVSEQYAGEIMTEEFGMGLEKIIKGRKNDLWGILNGIDYFKFDPATDGYLQVNYDEHSLDKKYENKRFLQKKFKLPVDDNVALFGIASRLAGHKGFDLVSGVVKVLLGMPIQMVVVGSGERQYMKLFEKLAKKYPKKLAAHLEFDEEVASWIYAGSDMYLMPSKFEPCGLSQLIALRYGSVPIVHKVGGLSDTIRDFDVVSREGNGFVFDDYHELNFYGAIVRALEHYKNKDVWVPLVKSIMQERFSWEKSIDEYEKVYRKAVDRRRG
ncbi:glycogen synthase [Patescibacteria group bacterium]|nr:glycogen synthase [Patescibacteria group bacterium]